MWCVEFSNKSRTTEVVASPMHRKIHGSTGFGEVRNSRAQTFTVAPLITAAGIDEAVGVKLVDHCLVHGTATLAEGWAICDDGALVFSPLLAVGKALQWNINTMLCHFQCDDITRLQVHTSQFVSVSLPASGQLPCSNQSLEKSFSDDFSPPTSRSSSS